MKLQDATKLNTLLDSILDAMPEPFNFLEASAALLQALQAVGMTAPEARAFLSTYLTKDICS